MDITLRRTVPADIPECGRILYEAFATLADQHGFPHDFPSVEAATGSMRALISNPGFYGIAAEIDGRVVGSSFLDERSTIHAIGPVSVDPAAQDHHVGRALMVAMLERAKATGTPGVRLVQISYHNRSLSLYAKLGMDVRGTFAAMHGDTDHRLVPGLRRARRDGGRRGGVQRPLPAGPRAHPGGRGRRARSPTARRKVVERLGRITAYTTGIHYFGHSVGRDERRPPGAHRRRRATSGPRGSSSPSTTATCSAGAWPTGCASSSS